MIDALHDSGCTAVLLGSPDEVERGRSLCARLAEGTSVIDLIGSIPLRETVAVIDRCTLPVGNDSGLGHVAATVGTPAVIISCHPEGAQAAQVNTPRALPAGGWALGGHPPGVADLRTLCKRLRARRRALFHRPGAGRRRPAGLPDADDRSGPGGEPWALTMSGPTGEPMAVRAVLFDRDGTLVGDVPYNGDPDKVAVRPGPRAAVDGARSRGLRTGVVTNQSGIGRGLLRPEQAESVNRRVDDLFGPFDVWGVCPHAPGEGCRCRKPAPRPGHRRGGSARHPAHRDHRGGGPVGQTSVPPTPPAPSGCSSPRVATEDGTASEADHVVLRLDELPALLDELAGCAR